MAGAPLVPYSYSVTGPLAGGFVGGNYQIDRFVAGFLQVIDDPQLALRHT